MDYKIISKIASGTFGTVYKVQNSTNGEFFALKLIHENYKVSKELKRIKRGFETAQKVSHPNCVKMVEWYEKGNDIGFVMEFVATIDVLTQSEAINGNSKSESLTNSQNLTDKISKIIQIANGLEALHSRGIVHRDLKPANILETVSGQIKITDFDLVKLDDSSTLTASGAFLGTAKYSSPEQCQNAAKIDFRSDLYSLGVLFYQLVCGRVPFDGDSLAEIALAHIRTPLISPKQFIPDLPEEINTVISKLLKKNPNDRFNSAQEVSENLSTFLIEGKLESLEVFGDFLLSPGFVGRRNELHKLNEIFSEMTGELKTVLFYGEQGVGKTKLWKEFKLGLVQKSTLLFETKCRKDSNIFDSLQTILTKALEQIENLSAKEQAEKVGKFGRDLIKILPQIEQKLFFKYLSEIPLLEDKDSELRLFEAVTTFLKNIQSKNKTLVFFFDDLQWLDEQSLRFVGYLTRSLADKSILVVGTVKNTNLEQISRQKKNTSEIFKFEFENVETLEIESFNLEEVREYLTKMFGKADPVNTKFCEEVLRRTGGNALFIQELMFHLLETKKISKGEDGWNLVKEIFSELKLPKSIQSVVSERLNFLKKDLLKVLEVGSLLGKYFRTKIVAGVLSISENEVESKLANPMLEGILEVSESGVFEFVNDSFKESLNNSIKSTTKKTLHKKIAIYLEKNFEESEVLEELASHFLDAKLKKKALEYSLKAGEESSKSKLLVSSLKYFGQAAEMIEPNTARNIKIRIFDDLGTVLKNSKKFEEAIKTYEKALEITEELSPTRLKFLNKICEVKSIILNFEEAQKVIAKLFELHTKINDKDNLALTFINKAKIEEELGNFDFAIESLKKALGFSQEINSEKNISQIYRALGKNYSTKGNSELAEECLKKGLEISLRLNDKLELIASNFSLANFYLPKQDFKKSIKYFEKCLELSTEIGLSNGILDSNNGLGVILYRLEKPYEALKYLSENIQKSKIDNKKSDFNLLIQNAIILNSIGEFEKAEKIYLEKIEQLSKSKSDELMLSYVYSNYGSLLVNVNRNGEALNYLEKVIKIIEKENLDLTRLYSILFTKCTALYNLNKFYEAKEVCEKANSFEEKVKDNYLKFLFNLKRIKIDLETNNFEKAIDELLKFKKSERNENFRKEIDYELCRIFAKTKSTFLIEKQIDFPKLKNEVSEFYELRFKETKKNEFKTKVETLKTFDFKSNEIYLELISKLTYWMDPETVFEELLRFLEKDINSDSCQIILKNKNSFETRAISPNLEEIEFSTSVLQKAIIESEPTLLKNVLEIPELSKNKSVIGKIFLSVIAVPLKIGEQVIGALYLHRTKIEKGFFAKSDMDKVVMIAKILSPVLERQNEAIKMRIESEIKNLGVFIGNSLKMKKVYEQIEEAANVNLPVYIYGETGTGKELVAESLHKLSTRRNKPFVVINCATISKELAESELFGHKKGSFTGALSDKVGRFEMAEGGTVFLDEIGELSLDIQAKLLRFLQNKEIWRIGGTSKTILNIRTIFATNKNLEMEVKKGNFREDLFYRINVLKIEVPPLRKRLDDIPLLANYFIEKYSMELGKKVKGISIEALLILSKLKWVGNVRELENFIAKLVLKTSNKDLINEKDLFKINPKLKPKVNSIETFESENIFGKIDVNGDNWDKMVDDFRGKLMATRLEKNNWRKGVTASELGISRVKLDRIIKQCNLKK